MPQIVYWQVNYRRRSPQQFLYATGRILFGSLRFLGLATAAVVMAFVNFWNIPVLGGEEAADSRYLRTGRHF